jgi:hypothetical protein|tara:strand:+ start:11587 stop:11835 length:249 start_codon:yes stop_codon:yes gene_type:complete
MIALKAKNEQDAKAEAVKLSLSNPGLYVKISACFGLFADLHKRLNVFAPTDTPFNWYVLNGKIKTFTNAQVVADQIATPMMS